MKNILLLRHAKSSHADRGVADFDRSLNQRGKKDASLTGHFISASDSVPNYIVSSTANRARQTTELVNDILGLETKDIRWNEDLYYGGATAYLQAIQNAGNNSESIMLVGHNPTIEECIGLLVARQSDYIARVPASGLICIEHPAREWKHIKPGTARLKWMVIPKVLKSVL